MAIPAPSGRELLISNIGIILIVLDQHIQPLQIRMPALTLFHVVIQQTVGERVHRQVVIQGVL